MSTGSKQRSPSYKNFHHSNAHIEVLNTGPRLNRTPGIAPAANTRPMLLCLCTSDRVNWKLTHLWVSGLFHHYCSSVKSVKLCRFGLSYPGKHWPARHCRSTVSDLDWARVWIFWTTNINTAELFYLNDFIWYPINSPEFQSIDLTFTASASLGEQSAKQNIIWLPWKQRACEFFSGEHPRRFRAWA